ncbi:MAG: hypothetical protein C7B46_05025 [Sulfobacillus benefaciens]|uniref:RNA polymerase sigma factor n=1 Tax=Sulfobacillus benefaciens TaxID=453960 RepID=A0A2T2XJ65_9FIRM|nr:MAG: hypothetical protein C7B46_05025 [Sulfobacillus benefaciens]
MVPPTDEELCRQVAEGRRHAMGHLFDRYAEPLARLIRMAGSPSEMVEDLVQETFLKAWKALERGQQPRRFKTWIRQIALNNLADYWRKPQSRQRELLDESLAEIGTIDSNIDDRILLEQLLASLPSDLRHIVILHFYQDLSLADISEVVGVPLGTVKSRLARAYRLMHDTLASWEEGEGYHVR